jgi:adenylate kinase family enzyme
MKIHIMGASCAGSTTLGRALSVRLDIPYFDTDDYFWKPSNPPYTVRYHAEERNINLIDAIQPYESYIVGGSVINWGDEWLTAFDLIVFLHIPPEIRLQRLKDREFERYGDVIYHEPDRIQAYQKYLDWAAAYDTNSISGRTLQAHEEWLRKLTCPVLNIRGNTTVQQRIDLVLNKMASINRP